MSPDSGVVDIIAISPEPGIEVLLDSMSDEAVVLLPVVDLHQPASVELALPPGVLPVMSDVREKVLMTRLKYFHFEYVYLNVSTTLPDNLNLSTLEDLCCSNSLQDEERK